MAYVGTCGMPGVQVNAGQLVGFAVSPSGGVHAQTGLLGSSVCVGAG